jgi:hypothetical protein
MDHITGSRVIRLMSLFNWIVHKEPRHISSYHTSHITARLLKKKKDTKGDPETGPRSSTTTILKPKRTPDPTGPKMTQLLVSSLWPQLQVQVDQRMLKQDYGTCRRGTRVKNKVQQARRQGIRLNLKWDHHLLSGGILINEIEVCSRTRLDYHREQTGLVKGVPKDTSVLRTLGK